MSNYSELLKDPRWQKKRLEIMNRDNWTCQSCFSTDITLHVHHLRYSGKPWEAPDICLITLCEKCHEFEEGLKDHDLYDLIADAGLTRENLKILLQHVAFKVKKTSQEYNAPFWAFHQEVLMSIVTQEELDELAYYYSTGRIKGSAKIAQPDHEQSEVEKQSSSS